jgi:hypothetical protein
VATAPTQACPPEVHQTRDLDCKDVPVIVIGADTHKSAHVLAAVEADTGQLLGEREIPATEQGQLDALRWAHEFDGEVVWAIERRSRAHPRDGRVSADARRGRLEASLDRPAMSSYER